VKHQVFAAIAAMVSLSATAAPPQSGWYWNPAESGRGFNIEIQGNTLFMAGFVYDTAGNPIWFVSAGPMSDDHTYSGAAYLTANGQPLGGAYRDKTNVPFGTATISFPTSVDANITVNGYSFTATREVFDVNSGSTLAISALNVLPSATAGQAYAAVAATASGGVPPYHFYQDTLVNGAPPLGMWIDVNGYLNGTSYTAAHMFTFNVCVADLTGTFRCRPTAIRVEPMTAPLGPTFTSAYFAPPPDNDPTSPFGRTTTTFDSSSGQYTVTFYDTFGHITNTETFFVDNEGAKTVKESTWVKQADWSIFTDSGDSAGIRSDHEWDVPSLGFPFGMQVGDVRVFNTPERVIHRSASPQLANTGSCGGTNWNVPNNGKAGSANPYIWEYVQQTKTWTALGLEDVTLPNGQVVSAFKMRNLIEETNNPFNGAPGVCAEPGNYSAHTTIYWLAAGKGVVKIQ